MVELTRKLSDLANALDAAGMPKVASVVDGVNSRSLNIKKAQYEGLQGYWIRNRRCWENCYRQKRAKTSLPAQEVWTECHKEYVEALGKEGTKWDKYASGINFTKTANKTKIKDIDQSFRKQVEAHVRDGLDIGTAAFVTIEKATNDHIKSLVAEAEKMAKVASVLKSSGKESLSTIAASASEDLYKEAQLFQKLKDFGKNKIVDPLMNKAKEKGRGFLGQANEGDITKRLQNLLKQTQNLRTRFPADMTKLTPEQNQRIQQQYQNLTQQVGNELQTIGKQTRNNPSGGQIYQKIMTPFQQFSQAQDPNSRRVALDNLGAAIGEAINTSANMETQPGQAQQNPAFQNRPNLLPDEQLGPNMVPEGERVPPGQQPANEQPALSEEEQVNQLAGQNGIYQDKGRELGPGYELNEPVGEGQTYELNENVNPAANEQSDGSMSNTPVGDEQPMTDMNEGAPPEQPGSPEVEQTKDFIDQLSPEDRQEIIQYLQGVAGNQERRLRMPQSLVNKVQPAQTAQPAQASTNNDRRSVKASAPSLGVEGKQFLFKLKKEF